LSSSLLCDDPEKFKQFYRQVRAGIINWNNPTTGIIGNVPFGGIGHSGNYRPSAYYAADYCAYPSVSVQSEKLTMPEQLPPGIEID
jgi:succinylglutamic semialdehyde dehydrogenase